MPAAVPLELTDRIIDFLWYDRASLRSCAVVSRGWRAASHYHLFNTFRLDDSTAPNRLNHIACTPRLQRVVEHLAVNSPLHDLSIVPYLFASIADCNSQSALSRPFASFPTLMGICSISYFPESLVDDVAIPRALLEAPRLLSITVAEVAAEELTPLLEWFRTTATRETLRKVKLWGVPPHAIDHVQALSDFVSATGDILEEFTVSCIPFYNVPTLDLTPAKSLRSVCLLDAAIGTNEILSLISQLSSCSLQELQLQITSLRPVKEEQRKSFWGRFSDILSQAGLKDLTKLVLWCGPLQEWSPESSQDILEADATRWLRHQHILDKLEVRAWDPLTVLW
ncbi:hypothetical protein CERSUDRAFT_126617 [Gelatoporia subvermispora B]|uniref:F-box domain-containing protein n=1 Tax=Ceriporiopsis subvermispora (strain B) TaxID=914234 RepID=M2Q7L8_CERS8|nr:hypothetical protein CERSUDRAFT_126617 [Gelatoporia subvermispora B]